MCSKGDNLVHWMTRSTIFNDFIPQFSGTRNVTSRLFPSARHGRQEVSRQAAPFSTDIRVWSTNIFHPIRPQNRLFMPIFITWSTTTHFLPLHNFNGEISWTMYHTGKSTVDTRSLQTHQNACCHQRPFQKRKISVRIPFSYSSDERILITIIIISGTTARIGPWPPLTGFRDG
jgi:hypothetical protein